MLNEIRRLDVSLEVVAALPEALAGDHATMELGLCNNPSPAPIRPRLSSRPSLGHHEVLTFREPILSG